ncbi:MAG: carboxy terminal-processing peptidase [Sphingobacteriaceae bacterium]|nr:carboxy terminal-processing peptidase [Sphingobacteriaceae bacterium]
MDFKSFKEMLKKIFLALFIVAAFACKANLPTNTNVEGSNNLSPEPQQQIVAKELVKAIEMLHYKRIKINDSLSSVIFDKYINSLDPSRNYFLSSDVKSFEKFRKSLDNQLREGDLSSFFLIFNTFQKRYQDRITYSIAQISKAYDFSKSEEYVYNREKLPWLNSIEEANQLWSKRIKYDLLNLRIASGGSTSGIQPIKIKGEDPRRNGAEAAKSTADTAAAKNRDVLKKRYQNLLSQAQKTNGQDAFQIMMDAFTQSVDPHTNYLVPTKAQEFNEEMARSFTGIGATLQLENEVVKVASVVPGGPAFKAKTLNAGDRIIAVAQGNDEFIDVIGWRLDNTVQKIKGPKGTTVRLKIIPAGQELSSQPKVISIVRDKVILEEQSAKKTIKTVVSEGKTYKIGVIDVPGFYLDFRAYQSGDPDYKSTTRDVRRIIDTLKQQNVDGIVIDLRTNGGGSLIEAIELTGLFIKTGPVVQVKDLRRTEVNQDDDEAIAWTGPMGVMIDRFSASASEIFAAAIQDYGRGVIMGTQTYGKGTVQQAIDMSKFVSTLDEIILKAKSASASNSNTKDGTKVTIGGNSSDTGTPKFGQINLTIAKFYRINGSSTQHKGVIPDIEFPMIYPAEKYGESSEPAALPFDMIKPAPFSPVANLASVKSQLAKQHQQRMKTSTEYKYLLEDIQQFKKREAENSVTLNEAQLKKERDEQEAVNLARTNQRRALQGLPALKKGEVAPKQDNDFIQDESLKVMADFIQLKETGKYSMRY